MKCLRAQDVGWSGSVGADTLYAKNNSYNTEENFGPSSSL